MEMIDSAKLLAGLIGTIFGFAISQLRVWLSDRKRRKAILVALSAEIVSICDYFEERRLVYDRFIEDIRLGRRTWLYSSGRDLAPVYRGNTSSLFDVPADLAQQAIRFYRSVDEFTSRSLTLAHALDEHNKIGCPSEDRDTIAKVAEGTFRRLGETVTDGQSLTDQVNKFANS